MPSSRRTVSVVALAALLLNACESGGPPRRDARQMGGTANVAPPKPATVAPTAAPANAAPPAQTAENAARKPNGVEFQGNVEWHTWEEALPLAAKLSKPIFVLVYADWCPHCRELGPVFADPTIEALSKRFVMVRQNHDDDPPWLQPYNQKYGGYVPRIFFFDSSAKLREDVTSGHPRYPFFYAAEHTEFLKASMQRVAGS